MKKLTLVLLCLIFFISGCSSKKSTFNPSISQVIKEIEVNTDYDPLTFIRCNDSGMTVDVITDEIIIHTLGVYNVEYEITDTKSKETCTRSFLITVVDKIAPVIYLTDEISIPVNHDLDLSSFVQIQDNYDANLMSKLTIEGEYDTSKVGEYRITLIVRDSSQNEARKTVTVYVEDDDQQTEDDTIYGTYSVPYNNDYITNPRLVLLKDHTFSLTINYCSGMQTFTGTFTENDLYVTLTSDGFTFDDNPSSSTITIQKNEDGSLTYMSSYAACSPIKNDIFYKE
ncbi:MAG: hypothetical protein PUF50_02160 [Erysipelotrichaceae bacterium]|nr:hypothetical protein [Erysipelotrichaceae bacterium]